MKELKELKELKEPTVPKGNKKNSSHYAVKFLFNDDSADGLGNAKHLIQDIIQGEKYNEAIKILEKIPLTDKDATTYNNLGVCYALIGNFDKAVTNFKMALSILPEYETAYSNLGGAFLKQGNTEEALKALERAVELDQNLVGAAAWYNLSLVYCEQRNTEKELEALERAVELGPDLVEAWNNLRCLHYEQGNTEKELEAIEEVIRYKPNFTVYYRKANILENQGKLKEAQAAYEEAIRCKPDSELAHMKKAYILKKQNLFYEAVIDFEKIVQNNPSNYEAWYNLGLCYERIADRVDKKDASFYRRVIQKNDDDAWAHDNLLKCNEYIRNLRNEAIKAYKQAPKHAEALCNLGRLLYDLNKPLTTQALAVYLRAIKCDPNFGLGYMGIGEILEDQGKLDKALGYYRKAVQCNPNSADAHYKKGCILSKQMKIEPALAAYEEATRCNPNFELAYVGKGLILEKQGKLGEALACFKKAVKCNPKSVVSSKIAYISEKLNELHENAATCKKAIEDEPGNSSAWFNLGIYYGDLSIGNLDEAAFAFRRVTELSPDDSEAWNNLGAIYERMGNLDKARSACQRAIEVNPNYSEGWHDLSACYESLGDISQAAYAIRNAWHLSITSSDLEVMGLRSEYEQDYKNVMNVIKENYYQAFGIKKDGTNKEQKPKSGEAILREVVKLVDEQNYPVNVRLDDDDTILHKAYKLGDEGAALVQFLLEKGANPNIKNKDGKKPIELAEYGSFRRSFTKRLYSEVIECATEKGSSRLMSPLEKMATSVVIRPADPTKDAGVAAFVASPIWDINVVSIIAGLVGPGAAHSLEESITQHREQIKTRAATAAAGTSEPEQKFR